MRRFGKRLFTRLCKARPRIGADLKRRFGFGWPSFFVCGRVEFLLGFLRKLGAGYGDFVDRMWWIVWLRWFVAW